MNTSYEKLSFYNNFFGGTIEGDNILTTDFYGNKQLIGVTTKKHQETLDLLNKYYNKLVELGVIEKEKTPEDIAKEQQQMMQLMMQQMKDMQDKLESLQREDKGEQNEYESDSKCIDKEFEVKSNTREQFNSINSKSKRDFKFSKQFN